MDFVEPDPNPVLDWESDRRGQQSVARDRILNDTGEPEQSAATIVDDGAGKDEDGTR